MSASLVFFPSRNGLKTEEFLTSGTFVVPTYVTEVFALVVGGGGGGSVLGSVVTDGTAGGGAAIVFAPMNVTPGETLTITVGIGGTGGPNAGGPGGSLGTVGGDSIVSGSLRSITSPGGGINLDSTGLSPFFGTLGGSPFGLNSGESTIYALGGVDGGGGASYGPGADRIPGQDAGVSASANTGAGGAGNTGPNSSGGNGGSGIVKLYYFENS